VSEVLQNPHDYYRYCPGEERITLSDAVCQARRRGNYPKCKGCQFNDDEKAGAGDSRERGPGQRVGGADVVEHDSIE